MLANLRKAAALAALALAAAIGAQALVAPAHAQSRGQGQNLGGGFIELLLTGRDPTPRVESASVRYGAPGGPPPAARTAPSRNAPEAAAPPRTTPRATQPRHAAPPAASPPRQRQAAITPGGGSVASEFRRQSVAYTGPHGPGTIVVDTRRKFLYLVQEGGTAIRYGVGVGREGFAWRGTERITRKAEWPDWRPPEAMRRRQPELPRFMPGGPKNPLGARALYLGNTLYRIHGTNEPGSIGRAMSSGCIRMMNDDVIDLYNRVRVGTRVVVM